MRLMLIPLFGQQVPDELHDFDIQGFVPKPFFADDLPDIVGEAMAVNMAAAPAHSIPELKVALPAKSNTTTVFEAPPSPRVAQEPAPLKKTPAPPPLAAAPPEIPTYSEETLAALKAKEEEIIGSLKSLNRELRAESIMVTLGAELVAFSGLLGREQAAELAALVATTTEAAARSAAFLGEPDGRFEQSLHEGVEYRLYSLTVSEELVLSLALSSDIPLGTLRYRARQTAEELLELLS
jgi:predicted regulator of Ras-like GTPase activity (Roadblock/LC7/MglB family)